MADVAKLAGVSHQTVSRVVNGSTDVRAATRERVLAAMTMLDYRPNSMARALATGRSHALGVVRVDTALHGPSSTLFGIERAAHAAGYHVHVASQRWLDLDSTLRAVERLRSQGVDGILVIGARREAAAALRKRAQAHRGRDRRGLARRRPAGRRRRTRARRPAGHRSTCSRSAMRRSGTSPGPSDSTDAQQRVRGWQSTLMNAGARVPALLQGDWSAQSGYELGREILERPEITAIFSGNDQMALGLLRRLHEAGRRVPGDSASSASTTSRSPRSSTHR